MLLLDLFLVTEKCEFEKENFLLNPNHIMDDV